MAAPDKGKINGNINGASFGDQQCFGVGMCIWNAQGDFLKALTKWFEFHPIPLQVCLGLVS